MKKNSETKKKTGRIRIAIRIFAAVMFVAGLVVYLIPTVENVIYDRKVAREKDEFFGNIAELEKQIDAATGKTLIDLLYDDMLAYNKQLYESEQENLADPFSYSQPNFELSKYGIYDNCIGFIAIEKMNITLPIYLGANNENMKNGAAHLTETSFPIGGSNSNAVIAAHRGTKKVMFRNIHLLENGDEVVIQNFRETLIYKVAEIKIIAPNDIHELVIQDGRDLVTLISCNPLGKNYQRIVVYCERTQ